MRCFPNELLDELLADHDTRRNVDQTIETVRALGLEPRPDVLREQAVLQELDPRQTELIVSLVQRRLAAVVTAR